MRAGCGLGGLLLGLSLAACGRIGVELLPEDSTPSVFDSPEQIPLLELDGGDDSRGILLPDGDGGVDGENHDDAGESIDAGLPSNIPADTGIADASSRDASVSSDTGTSDASATDAGSRASTGDAGTDAGTSPCAGRSVFGVCWYLGAASASCDTECATHGGFDTRATSYVGTERQGGSLAACTQILTALGRPGTVGEGMRDDDYGMGCHLWVDNSRWWLGPNPDFRPSVAVPDVRIACGCLR